MREWMNRLVDMFRRNTLDRELAEELDFHRRHLEQGAVDDGLTNEAARLQARRQLGNVTSIAEDTREQWTFRWVDHLRQDLRFAWRGLRRTPAFTLTVVLILSLGIGANAVMFGVVDRLMFRPLDYLRDPGSVNRLYLQTLDRGIVTTTVWIQYQRYRDLQDHTSSFSHFAAVNDRTMAVGMGDAVRELRVAGVTASYFDFFDATPAAGRFFDTSEDVAPHGTAVAVLAHSFWNAEYGRRNVIGEPLVIGDLSFTIVGVAPQGFTGLDDAAPAQVFLPLTAVGPAYGAQLANRFSVGYDSLWGHTIVRRKPGVSAERASADATEAYRLSWDRERAQRQGAIPMRTLEDAQPRAVVSALRTGGGPAPSLDARTSVWVGGVAALLLVITIANVGNLLLGRTMARRQETAVRLALGVSTRRLMSHLLTESVVLAVCGAAGALLMTSWFGTAVFAFLAATTEPVAGILDVRTVGFTATITIVVALTMGVVPTWIAARSSTTSSVRTGTREVGGGRTLPTALVVTQAALSLVLLVGALLFVRSLSAVQSMSLGYQPDRIVMVNQVLRGPVMAPEARIALRKRLMESALAHPAVELATWRYTTPLGSTMRVNFSTDTVESAAALGLFSAQQSTVDYFRVMGTSIVRGRGFTEEDRAGAPLVAVVSEGAARALWPADEPLGKCMRFGRPPAACTSVIGIAEDIVSQNLTTTERYQIYLPLDQTAPDGGSGMFLRVRGDATVEAESIRRALRPLMPGTSYLTAQPMDTLLARPQRSWRMGATMFSAFGVLALVVAAIGLFGVISHGVAQRRREVGVRLALGATRRDIIWLVTRQGLLVALAGVAAGVAMALMFSGRLQPMLFDQSARDPGVYVAAAGVLLFVAVLATLIPAVRASGTNPTEVLRGE